MYKIIFSKVLDLFFTSIYFFVEANNKFPDETPSMIPNLKNTEVSERG